MHGAPSLSESGEGLHLNKGTMRNAARNMVFVIGTPLEKIEAEVIRRTLVFCAGSRKKTAQVLGLHERTIGRKLDTMAPAELDSLRAELKAVSNG